MIWTVNVGQGRTLQKVLMSSNDRAAALANLPPDAPVELYDPAAGARTFKSADKG
jgi:hypothetical protein